MDVHWSKDIPYLQSDKECCESFHGRLEDVSIFEIRNLKPVMSTLFEDFFLNFEKTTSLLKNNQSFSSVHHMNKGF